MRANGKLHRQKRDLAGKTQKAKKASGVNPTQKRRTTPLLPAALNQDGMPLCIPKEHIPCPEEAVLGGFCKTV